MRTARREAGRSTVVIPADATAHANCAVRDVSASSIHALRVELTNVVRRARWILNAAERSVDLDLDLRAQETLAHVVANHGTSTTNIAECLQVDEDVATRWASQLEQLGLVTTLADVRHPARGILVATAMGRRVHERGTDAALAATREALEGWSASEVELLTRLLAKLSQVPVA